jgi:hypothetical protein
MRTILMRLGIFVMLSSAIVPCGAHAQPKPGDAGTCYADFKEKNRPFRKTLWDGYEVSLGPARDGEAEESCTAAIYRADGKVVYRTTGFNVIFDQQHTGMDFDGDGTPEVVFKTDTGGGMHCCWEFNVISLSPKPHKLFDIPQPGLVRFEKDAEGKMVIWTRLPGPYEFTSMAVTPFAERAWRVKDGKMVDATAEFCPKLSVNGGYEDDWERPRELNAEALRKWQEDAPGKWEDEEVVSAVLSRALQYVFCRQFDKAEKDLNLWPESHDRAKMKADFAAAIRTDYPEFAERIAGPAGKQVNP